MGLKEIVKSVSDAINPPSAEAAEARRLLTQYRAETENNGRKKPFKYDSKPSEFPGGRAILDSTTEMQVAVLRELFVRIRIDSYSYAVKMLADHLLVRKLPLSLADVEALLDQEGNGSSWTGYWGAAIRKTRQYLEAEGALTPALTAGLNAIRTQATAYNSADNRKFIMQIDELLGTSTQVQPDAGEAWADKALSDLEAMTPEVRSAWDKLFAYALTAESAKPSAKWLAEAARHREAVGEMEMVQHLTAWLNLATPPLPFEETAPQYDPRTRQLGTPERTLFDQLSSAYYQGLQEYRRTVSEKNIVLMKGLAWYTSQCPTPEMARAVGLMTQAAFTSVVGYGTWATKAGNAGIWALGQMPSGVGVGPLARLRTRLRDRGALKLISSAIEAAAKSAGMTVDELEDLAVPTGGLDADGTRREEFGAEGAALLTLDAKTGRTRLEWFGADGKARKAVPAGVKREFAAEVKALKAAEAEVSQALSAQAARMDGFLASERTWPLSVWRERYGSHPILGNLARRLLWSVDGVVGLPGAFAEGAEDAEVKLWHPITAQPEEVMQWRDALEGQGIVQPFKQAHREVYLLTDAERNTRTYSNRFAAHILKQHQFNSLCVLRGWKNALRLMVDDEYPPATLPLPKHSLRAEFWVEGIGDNYGTDTNETGTYLRLATDQVRFYKTEAAVNYARAGGGGYATGHRQAPAEPLPLDQIPPLVLSEVMRDVDLFVGVASVGNDPTWADGGPEGRFRNYWQDYAFGDLGETAKTRAAVLARLLPRLKIADRCELDGKFLTVRGELRTYKIHLGSGNILMEPNDQYLCIVPGRSEETNSGDLFLPFEGDRMLAIVLSKAFLLADDKAIKDPSIVSQIKRGG